MLAAKSRRSRFSHDTGIGGYSKPTPGPALPLIVTIRVLESCREGQCVRPIEERRSRSRILSFAEVQISWTLHRHPGQTFIASFPKYRQYLIMECVSIGHANPDIAGIGVCRLHGLFHDTSYMAVLTSWGSDTSCFRRAVLDRSNRFRLHVDSFLHHSATMGRCRPESP
jgi:hypothetical protein